MTRQDGTLASGRSTGSGEGGDRVARRNDSTKGLVRRRPRPATRLSSGRNIRQKRRELRELLPPVAEPGNPETYFEDVIDWERYDGTKGYDACKTRHRSPSAAFRCGGRRLRELTYVNLPVYVHLSLNLNTHLPPPKRIKHAQQ